jgi:AraC-like DNA-binding protein
MQVLQDGGYTYNDQLAIDGEGTTDFVFARGWLLEVVDLEAGQYFFLSDGKEVRPAQNRFGVFYPSFTFVRAFAQNIKGRMTGIGNERSYLELPNNPFIFETDHRGEFASIDQAFEVLRRSRNRQSIEVRSEPSRVSGSAKRLIDENYLVFPSIARIADRLKVSHEHLSRQFKKDYGLSPSAYLHKLRVAEATFRLSLGEEIVDISLDVGYNDLSRFYKQFRKATDTSPAMCRKQIHR